MRLDSKLSVAAFVAVVLDAALLRFLPGGTTLVYLARLSSCLVVLAALLASGVPRTSLGVALGGGGRVLYLAAGCGAGLYAILIGIALLFRWDLPFRLGRDFHDWNGAATFAINALLLAPIMEETLYRGIVVSALRHRLPVWGVVVVSGLFFYLLHLAYGKDWRLLHYLPAGMILGWAFLASGRLWVPILLHMLGNLLMALDDVARL